MIWKTNRIRWFFLLVPGLLQAVTLPSASFFPMRVGIVQELTNSRGDTLRWEVSRFVILNDEDTESDVRIEWKISHKGSFSFVYTVGFVVTLDGEVHLDSLSDGSQVRSFFPRILFLDARGQFVEAMIGEGISLSRPGWRGRFTWGKIYPEVSVVTLGLGTNRMRLLWDRTAGLIGIEGGVSYYPK